MKTSFALGAASLLLACVSTACGGNIAYATSVTTAKPTLAKPTDCDFQILSTTPNGNYDELATLSSTGAECTEPNAFRKAIHEEVCLLGGDAVVAKINNEGVYTGGTVLRRVQ